MMKDKQQSSPLPSLFPEPEIGFNARIFVQCNLPYKDPGPDLHQWSRVNGTARLVILPMVEEFEDSHQEAMFPYGAIPRLMMTYLTTQAVKSRRREIPLGTHVADFMRSLGMAINTRARRRLRDQMMRLFKCAVRYSNEIERPDGVIHEGGDISVASEYSLWFGNDLKDETPELFIPYVQLGERFFDEIVDRGFPIDMEHVAALKKSPLALDLYSWGVLRNNSIKKPTFIPWKRLSEQFGNPYGRNVDFKIKAINELNNIKEVWKDWKATPEKKGLRLSPSTPPIKKLTVTVPKSIDFNRSTRTYKIWHENGGSDETYQKLLSSFGSTFLEPHETEMLDDLLPSGWADSNLEFFRMSKAIIGWRFNELIHVLNIAKGIQDGLKYFRSTLLNAVKLEAEADKQKLAPATKN